MTEWLYRSVLFIFQIFVDLTLFLLISGFTPLWSVKIVGMITVFLNLLRFVLLPIVWCILENVPCALEKNVYYAAIGWNALCMSIKSISSKVWFSPTLPC